MSPAAVDPNSGDVHPKTSPFDLGLHYGKIIFVNPRCFSNMAFVNKRELLNCMMPIKIIGLFLKSLKFYSMLSTKISMSNLISTNT